MSELSGKRCSACVKGMQPLSMGASLPYLQQIPEWHPLAASRIASEAHSIEREFVFKSFPKAFGFVSVVGALAENEGHHPDIRLHGDFNLKKVTITLRTYIADGLTENDFILAAKIDKAFSV